MPITRHTIATTTAPDGSTDNILRMFDQDEVPRGQITFRSEAGPDMQGRIATRITAFIDEANAQLAEMEYQQIVGSEE